ncbi:MAG: DsbA family protein, partial [Rickettsiales bacterium]
TLTTQETTNPIGVIMRKSLSLLAVTTGLSLNATQVLAEEARTYTREEIEKIVVETIIKNPEAIIESMELMQDRAQKEKEAKAKANLQAYRTSLYEDEHSPRVGNKKPKVTVVEFFDYNCGYCKRSLDAVQQLIDVNDDIQVIFKEVAMLAPSSADAAKAALAMYKLNPDRYFDFHAALFSMNGRFDDKNLAGVAEGMGVDPDTFLKMKNSPEIKKQLDDNMSLAQKMEVTGIPVFIIGDQLFPGAIPYDVMQEEIDLQK